VEIIRLIKENGGTYSGSISKAVTHLVAADPEEDSKKLNDARSKGIKVVGEKFLKAFMK
jgi:NAD-dependent DNA ligase